MVLFSLAFSRTISVKKSRAESLDQLFSARVLGYLGVPLDSLKDDVRCDEIREI